MAIKIIADDCDACGVCFDECPNGAIQEGVDFYSILTDECTDCMVCLQACPNGAIVEE